MVGLGAIGLNYRGAKTAQNLTHFEALKSNSNLELKVCIDLQEPTNWTKHIKFIPNLSSLTDRLDVIIVATPTSSHLQIIHEISKLKNKPKVILLEKPAGKSLSEARKILSISKQIKVPIFVNFFRESNKKVLSEILLGLSIENIEVRYTGTLINSGYHLLSLIKSLFQQRFTDLKSNCSGDYEIHGCKLNDISLISVGKKNQTVPENQIIINGNDFKIIYDNENNMISRFKLSNNPVYLHEEIYALESSHSAGLDKGLEYVCLDLVNFLSSGLCSLPSIGKVVELREEFNK